MPLPLRRIALLVFAAWWGGLTIYAAIVVPVGADVLDATTQGFVTRRVTHWLNGLAGVAAAAALTEWWGTGRRAAAVTALLLAVTLLILVPIHHQLDRLLDVRTLSVSDPDRFYLWHRVYLWVTTVQWLAGLAHLWGLIASPHVGVDRQEFPGPGESGQTGEVVA